MRNLNQSVKRSALLFIVLISIIPLSFGQNTQNPVQEMNSQSSLEEQLKYVEEHTRIYENFRAVREDMFQRLKRNILDSISSSKKKINNLNNLHGNVNRSYDSLQTSLAETKTQLDEITETKDSISFLGMEVSKKSYNTIMWTLIFIFIILFVIGYLLYNRNRSITVNTKKDLEDLKLEFEAYRKTSREAREKADMAHFNEIQKLRGRS